MIEKFNGQKFRCVDKIEYNNPNVWWADEKVEKKKFIATKEYSEYLAYKKRVEYVERVRVLKQKLEYEQKKFGEVDEYDFMEYCNLVGIPYQPKVK